jgi:hypothetical protein
VKRLVFIITRVESMRFFAFWKDLPTDANGKVFIGIVDASIVAQDIYQLFKVAARSLHAARSSCAAPSLQLAYACARGISGNRLHSVILLPIFGMYNLVTGFDNGESGTRIDICYGIVTIVTFL